MNHRRNLLVALGTGALAAPFGAFGQPAKASDKLWRVGFLAPRPRPASIEGDYYGGFPQGMRERGWVEGRNLVIEWRFANGDPARLPGLVAELVQSKVDLIVTAGTPGTSAAQKATRTIPIVMTNAGDPVGSGLVNSLARPGGNITGVSVNLVEIVTKQLGMLLDMAPRLARVAVLINPVNTSHAAIPASLQAAASKTKVKLLLLEARSAAEIEPAFAAMKRDRAGAVIVPPDAIYNDAARQMAEFAMKHRLLSITSIREYVDAGCLMSYGTSFRESFRRAAYYVDRIFKGTKPADLPVEEPTKYDLFINGKTAKALGLKIPHSLLITAEKVIE